MERELEKLEQYLGAERNDESEHKKINEQLRQLYFPDIADMKILIFGILILCYTYIEQS